MVPEMWWCSKYIHFYKADSSLVEHLMSVSKMKDWNSGLGR